MLKNTFASTLGLFLCLSATAGEGQSELSGLVAWSCPGMGITNYISPNQLPAPTNPGDSYVNQAANILASVVTSSDQHPTLKKLWIRSMAEAQVIDVAPHPDENPKECRCVQVTTSNDGRFLISSEFNDAKGLSTLMRAEHLMDMALLRERLEKPNSDKDSVMKEIASTQCRALQKAAELPKN